MIRDFDELRDISIRMVDRLVEEGLIKDCTDDPDDSTEFDVQDLLIEELISSLKQDDCITPKGVNPSKVELKEINEDYGIAFISVDDIPLGIFTLYKDEEYEEPRLFVSIDYNVTYVDSLI